MNGGRSGGSGGSLMGGNDDSPANSAKDENSYMEGREKKPIPVPTALIETVSFRVCPKTRLGFNIRQRDNRVMRIHWSSPLHNKMCIGDKILKFNDVAFDMKSLLKAVTPHKSISCSSESIDEGHAPVTMKITIERAVYSWSRLEMTTLEQFELPNSKKIFTGRPLKRYTVVLRRPRLPGIELAPIGISLRYDSSERVTVAGVTTGSLGSAHLRPWDIIKRVNGDEVRSKTMCAFMIVRSLKDSGQVILDVEVLKKCSSRDTMEMPEDVVKICANQIGVIKSGTLKSPLPIIIVRPSTTAASPKKDATSSSSTSPGKTSKSEKEKRLTHAAGPHIEQIVSDVEEGTVLKLSKFANVMSKK